MDDAEAGLKRAMEWIAHEMRENPRANRLDLVDLASQRYMLSPRQTQLLCRYLVKSSPTGAPGVW
jgi:hypothetical protein